MNMELLCERLRFLGVEAQRYATASEAIERIDDIAGADLVILDIIMPWPAGIEPTALDGPRTGGMQLFLEMRRRKPALPVIAFSATQDGVIIDAISEDPKSTFISKWGSPSLREMCRRICRSLGVGELWAGDSAFIVHGRDETRMLSLKNYLQNRLGIREPIVLREQPNLGRTIIEKLEDYGAGSTLVFALLTPDDLGATGDEPDDVKRRARQNVIFELGFFIGHLGRRSGRVLLLHSGPIELPSDLSGLVYIDISGGIEAAGERIRKELEKINE
jgi:CheY-like chemotaxis protein